MAMKNLSGINVILEQDCSHQHVPLPESRVVWGSPPWRGWGAGGAVPKLGEASTFGLEPVGSPKSSQSRSWGFQCIMKGIFFFLSVLELYGDFAYSCAKLVNIGGIDGC